MANKSLKYKPGHKENPKKDEGLWDDRHGSQRHVPGISGGIRSFSTSVPLISQVLRPGTPASPFSPGLPDRPRGPGIPAKGMDR